MRPIILIITLVFVACNGDTTQQPPVQKDAIQVSQQDISNKLIIKDSIAHSGTMLYVWLVNFEDKTKKKNPSFKIELLNVDTLIKGLNEAYPNIKLDKVKMSSDTLITKIDDSEYLGERIGSNGAASYLANVIINLTSIDKIKYVKIDFDEGSHASPGVWSAKDFSDYKEVR